MRRLAIALAICLASLSTAASASYVDACSAYLSAGWSEQVSTHPLDDQRHIAAVLIGSPVRKSQRVGEAEYQRALVALKRAFPSFEEAPTSGILAGCCQIPVWGMISREDLEALTRAHFVRLCEVAKAAKSTAASVRIENRSSYEHPENSESYAPYFFLFWQRKAHV